MVMKNVNKRRKTERKLGKVRERERVGEKER